MKVDIAIMTIRDDESDAVFNRLEEYLSSLENGASGRTYAIFSVPTRTGKACAVALARCPEQGADVAQQVASDIIRDLDPRLILVVGIAGGIPHNEFTLGDVIISSRIHNFNVNAVKKGEITFDVKGGIHPFVSNITASLPLYKSRLAGWNEPGSIGMPRPIIEDEWVQSNVYGDAKWSDKVLKSLTAHFSPDSPSRSPLFKTGSIASSNSLMKDTDIPTTWLESARSILAIEMESAGALQAAQQMEKQYPVMAIRGISDIIGLNRDERWTPYACQSAGAFTVAFIKAGIVEPRESSTTTATSQAQPSHTPAIQQSRDNATTATGVQGSEGLPPLDVFISYSADDEKLKHELETHLVMLKRKGVIRPWHSEQVKAGLEWEKEISNRINQSQIILLLISPSFLASDQLYEREMLRAMDRHESGDARVIPIIIRSANIADTPFSKLLILPRNLQPVDTWRNRDEIWARIAEDIRNVCNDLRNKQKQ